MSEPPPTSCPNCATELIGPCCHGCGQPRRQSHELEVRHFVREFTDDALHLNFKTLRSVAAVLRPGYLTSEYLQGRRARYTRPVQLYLICGAVFFFLAPVAGFTLDALLEQDTSGTLRQALDERAAQRGMDHALFAERFNARLQTIYTVALSISIATVALLLKGIYRRPKQPFGAHLVFAVHYVSFLYLAAVVLGGVKEMTHLGPAGALAAGYAVIAPYLFVALKRVYRETAVRTALKTVVLLAVSFVVDNLVNFGSIYAAFQSV